MPERRSRKDAVRNREAVLAAADALFSRRESPEDVTMADVAAAAGVGKGTLYKALFARHPGAFALSISHTTRSPRPGEQHGVDYYYVTKDEFKELVAQNKFVEKSVNPRSTLQSPCSSVLSPIIFFSPYSLPCPALPCLD